MTKRAQEDTHCRSCRYWDPTSEGNAGWCRKEPPVPFLGKRNAEAIWPMTQALDWCGAFVVYPGRDRRQSGIAP